MKKGYKLTITQKEPEADKDFFNVIEGEDLESLFENLARCFRDLNRTERAPAIKSAKHWIRDTYNDNKTHCFTIIYDVYSDNSKFSVYNWEFYGLGDEI